jgi:hypothetical protein
MQDASIKEETLLACHKTLIFAKDLFSSFFKLKIQHGEQ